MGEKRLPHVRAQGWKEGVPYKGPVTHSLVRSLGRSLTPSLRPRQPLDGVGHDRGSESESEPDPAHVRQGEPATRTICQERIEGGQ